MFCWQSLHRGGICDSFYLLSLSQSDHDDLRYVQDDGTEAPLSIGHKGMLKTLKLFTAYNMAEGHPIDDWTQVTKKDFDDFRSSNACISATEKDNNVMLPTPLVISKKKISLLTSRKESREMIFSI